MAFVRYDERDENYATNLWRSWFLRWVMPQAEDGGPITKPFVFSAYGYSVGDTLLTASDVLRDYELAKKYGITGDVLYHDIGWSIKPDGTSLTHPYAPSSYTGTWEIDLTRFPGGFKPLAEAVGAKKVILWHQPEWVETDAQSLDVMVQKYGFKKEWLLPGPTAAVLTDYSNEECFEWVYDRVSKNIDFNGVNLYREDFNIWDVSEHWYRNDAPDRKGITEIKHVMNHYRLWDKLLEEFPGLTIDTCASGGGRLDLETMRRASVLLTKSDYYTVPITRQIPINASLFSWIPVGVSSAVSNGAIVSKSTIRRSYSTIFTFSLLNGVWDEYDYRAIRDGLEEWRTINKYMYSDYYLLTEYAALDEYDKFTAWQFFDRVLDSGYIQVFKQRDCGNSITINLQGVAEDKYYKLIDADGAGNSIEKIKGSELKNGITIIFSDKGAIEKDALLLINPV